jgi:hypothetical protein
MVHYRLLACLLTLYVSTSALASTLPSDAPASATTATAAATDNPSALKRFTSKPFGFYIDYPSDFEARKRFDIGYFLTSTAWRLYADPAEKGTPVVALVLKGSNDLTRGELRIGVSRAAKSIRTCLQPPAGYQLPTQRSGHVQLAGLDFTTFELTDAGMNHRLNARSYRVEHAGACYAIDLIVSGANGDAYDPPRTPPFSDDHAFSRLERALQGLRFFR